MLARISVRVAKNCYHLSFRIDIGANLLVVNMATNPDGIMVEHVEELLGLEVEVGVQGLSLYSKLMPTSIGVKWVIIIFGCFATSSVIILS